MAVFNKTAFIVLIVVLGMIATIQAISYVGPCDQVCNRINPEKDECCRAHGYSGHAYCSRGYMYCR